MSERDYNRQVVKRERINRATLVVGVDVGNAWNAVGFMDKEGNVLGSCAKLYNSREGFEQFVKMTEGFKERQGMKDVLIGLEPTGHYWRKLAYFAKDQGLWAVLDRCPFPEDVVSMKRSLLRELIARILRKKAGAAEKAKALCQAAKKSIGVKRIGSADRYRGHCQVSSVKSHQGFILKGFHGFDYAAIL